MLTSPHSLSPPISKVSCSDVHMDGVQDPSIDLAMVATGRMRSRACEVRRLARLVPEAWLAKASVVAAQYGQSKSGAMMLAVLTVRDVELLAKVFHRSVLDVSTLRHYVAYLRSNRRRSLGSRPKKLVQEWLNACPAWILCEEAFGEFRPSLADIVRATHPKPNDSEHSNVYAWMVGRPTAVEDLPMAPRNLEKPLDGERVSRYIRPNESVCKVSRRSSTVVEGVEL